jgi:hypothetical protein
VIIIFGALLKLRKSIIAHLQRCAFEHQSILPVLLNYYDNRFIGSRIRNCCSMSLIPCL